LVVPPFDVEWIAQAPGKLIQDTGVEGIDPTKVIL